MILGGLLLPDMLEAVAASAPYRATVRIGGEVMTHTAVSRAQETVWKDCGGNAAEGTRATNQQAGSGLRTGTMIAEIKGGWIEVLAEPLKGVHACNLPCSMQLHAARTRAAGRA